MRYAIISDIHANLQAWNAVLLDIRSLRVDQIICLGDIIGYGPNPREVMQSVYTSVDHFVLGNHDAAFCGKLDEALFNDSARGVLRWTRAQLGDEAHRFFGDLPLCLAGDGFRCTHGEFAAPGHFRYVIDPADALPSWQAAEEPVLFIGHTHRPGIFLIGQSGTPHFLEPQDFVVEEGKRFIVNPGSVGQPRDGDARASYCIYDTTERAVYWRRIPFDLDAYRAALLKAGVPESASYFLTHDPRQGKPPIRTVLGFNPPTEAAQAAKVDVEVRDIQVLQGRVRRWRRLFVLLAALFVCTAAVGAWGSMRYVRRSLELPGADAHSIDAASVAVQQNMLPPFAQAGPQGSLTGWSIRLGNRYGQTVHPEPADGDLHALLIRSTSANDEVVIWSPEIRVHPDMRLSASALFRKGTPFSGSIGIVVSAVKREGDHVQRVEQLVVKEPNQRRNNDWIQAQTTFSLPAGTESVQLSLRARLSGEVLIRDVSLVRK